MGLWVSSFFFFWTLFSSLIAITLLVVGDLGGIALVSKLLSWLAREAGALSLLTLLYSNCLFLFLVLVLVLVLRQAFVLCVCVKCLWVLTWCRAGWFVNCGFLVVKGLFVGC
jgi:hypothetical protein